MRMARFLRNLTNGLILVTFSDMDIDIEDNGDGTFSIYYSVKDVGEYSLNIKFGGQTVPDGAYTVTVSRIRWSPLFILKSLKKLVYKFH